MPGKSNIPVFRLNRKPNLGHFVAPEDILIKRYIARRCAKA
jgi:hypothetical protein